MDLPYNWDFIQNNIPPEKLAELRRRFMEEWRSGNYTKEEMIERYRMSERTFRDTIKRYPDTRELDDYKDDHGRLKTHTGNLQMQNIKKSQEHLIVQGKM
jgi:transposase